MILPHHFLPHERRSDECLHVEFAFAKPGEDIFVVFRNEPDFRTKFEAAARGGDDVDFMFDFPPVCFSMNIMRFAVRRMGPVLLIIWRNAGTTDGLVIEVF
jgi:hypothetical protein